MKKTKFFAGLDVHQDLTYYAVRTLGGEIVLGGECATRFEDLYEILEPYLHSCKIGIESCTSYYHIYQGFKKKKCDIVVFNTIRLRQLVAKNDRFDAERLSDMLRLGNFPISYVPDEKIMKLRTMMKLRHNFVEESTRFQNQIHSILAKHGLRIHERTSFSKKWCEKLMEIISSYPQQIELRYAFEHYRLIQDRIDQITAEVINYCRKHWNKQLELLDSIPGIAEILACYFISEIWPIKRFQNNKKLRRYAGVIPCIKESGGHTYGNRIPKGSSRALLRWALVQATHAALKGQNNLRKYYAKKKKTRLKTKAIMAVASSLCDIIFRVLASNKPYSV